MSGPFSPGLYECLVSEDLARRLDSLTDELHARRGGLHPAEAPDRIALYLARVIERVIADFDDRERSGRGIQLARRLLEYLESIVEDADTAGDLLVERDPVLNAILTRRPDGSPAPIDAPLIPLLDTTLLTNAPDEPRVLHQINTEIRSADRIDVLMAFIRKSGIRPLVESIRRHCDQGRACRFLTTTYTGSTQADALDMLTAAGADVRVSYDTGSTRLHAKAWLFHRDSGFSTAYVGSSNLTHSAQVTGLEWNVRISGARNADVIDKIGAVFESYWVRDEFRPYQREDFVARSAAARPSGTRVVLPPVELTPRPFQERLLEQIAVSRRHGRHRNLLVSATGTGKTVMAALDYARLRRSLPRARLLFVAHRQEILEQSLALFCLALGEPGFGEMWSRGERPDRFDHVFASIQSLHAETLSTLDPDHFDVVIVDEFHHAAAASYDRLLRRVRPRELLGLTATPERADGQSVLTWFDDRVAAELRLWDAIDQQLLSPFSYFGLHDGADLTRIPWRRGRGYDVAGLSNLFTSSDAWARVVVKAVVEHVDDVATMKALGFCVSVDHARYMARIFTEAGIPSVAVSGTTPDAERRDALDGLREGRTRVVFSVDLFNEGVDVPSVDTLLLLRPTDSPTLFLQQLGRGLRREKEKSACTVLDFVGHHRTEFRFDRRLRGLLGGTRRDLERQVEQGFPYLPAGCHMELDSKASAIVLRSIRESVPTRWAQKAEELRSHVAAGRPAELGDFLHHSGLELTDVYAGARCWSDLCDTARVPVAAAGPNEKALRRAVSRLLHVDDDVRLQGYLELLARADAPRGDALPTQEARLARMLVASLLEAVADRSMSLQAGLDLVWQHPQMLAELRQLFGVLADGVDHLHEPLPDRSDVPLQIHGRYTRIEIFAAFGVGEGAKVAAWQTGVRWLPDQRADLFAFTLDKTDGNFSPTTRYRDYAISPELIHWESQSVTREDSPTGRRYLEHARRGSEVILFARVRQSERAFWCLGPANYVKHQGERPMAITWRLATPLPGDLFARFAAAVA